MFTMLYVYVTNSTQRTITDVNTCDRFSATSRKNPRNITCTKTLSGDQIVITTNSTKGRLLVYEIQVYGKFIFCFNFNFKKFIWINDIALVLFITVHYNVNKLWPSKCMTWSLQCMIAGKWCLISDSFLLPIIHLILTVM